MNEEEGNLYGFNVVFDFFQRYFFVIQKKKKEGKKKAYK